MGCLVVLLGFVVGIWGLATIITLFEGVMAAKIISLCIEAVFVFLFVKCLKKYRSPENQEKMKQAREKSKQQMAETKIRWEEDKAKRKEAERLRTTIVATRLIGDGAAEYKKSVGSMAARGAIGSVFGPAGAMIGMATAKNKNTNKNVRRFLVKYLDGHIEEKEATVGSATYKEYMAHLEWNEQ